MRRVFSAVSAVTPSAGRTSVLTGCTTPLAHRCSGALAASGLVLTRDFSRVRCAGDNGKYQKDRRVKRLKNWTRKQTQRQAELQDAVERLGTDDVEWYDGEYYPRVELQLFLEERRQALRASTTRIVPETANLQ